LIVRRILLPLLTALLLASGCGSDSKPDAGTTATTPASDTAAAANSLPGAQLTPPPWSPGGDQLQERLDALGLAALPAEGTVVHIHQHLDLLVDGQRAVVPAYVGIDPDGRFIAALHTHDPTGLMHVESDVKRIGGLKTGGGKQLKTWVNGKPVNGDPSKIDLASHQEIVIAYGTADQIPAKVPARYRFPPGT
jgi:hypothetical protein